MTRQLKIADGRFSIVLPGTWATIPLEDDAELQRHVRELVIQQVGRNDRFAGTRREIREQLTDAARQARDNRAISFAVSLELLPGVPFPASMIVAEDAWPPAVDELDLDTLQERLRAAQPRAEIVEFVSGPVARIAEFGQMQLDTQKTPEVAAQYWRAVDDGARLFRIFMTAPMAEFPELYLELFDAIVDSMIWIPDAEPDAE